MKLPAIEARDVVVIGAGVSGLYQLYRLRQLGCSAMVLEAGSDVGGTWYWNRYPGARFDSESYSYGYSFSPELLDEWQWSEHFSAQPETLRYLQHVAERFDLRRDIRFGSRVISATWAEDTRHWLVCAEDGFAIRCQYLITAIGALTAPTMPMIDGLDDFDGPAFHTARWPHTAVDFRGQRVGVIGTGASGVQVIQEVAKTAAQLTVFQRHPNWCAPLNNAPIDESTRRDIAAHQTAIFEHCNSTFGGFLHGPVRVNALDVTPAERERFWEKLYAERGFGIAFGNYRDVLIDARANRLLSDFIAKKIRQRVHDPRVAELLIPTDHGFGTRRVPLETGYYEAYNQDNVELVDLRQTPIERITAAGIRTTAMEYPFDLIILATGFNAVVGAFEDIDIRGVDNASLKRTWASGPRTHLGVQTPGFPNLFMIVGPHSASTFCNMPRCIEHGVDWVSDCIRHLRNSGSSRIEATQAAAAEWTAHTYEMVDRLLMSKVDSWFHGVNANLPGRKRTTLIYAGGLPMYRQRCAEVAAAGYRGFAIN